MGDILHVTFSSSGGAGKFAHRLNAAQIEAGIQSRIVTFNDGGLSDSKFEHPVLSILAALDFGVVRKDTQKPLVTLFRDRVSLFKLNEHLDADTVLHLHWTPGVINRETIEYVSRTHKVVWTLHDMFPITGGCHHSLGCHKFESNCAGCPQVRRAFKTQIEQKHLDLCNISHSFENIMLVSPSRWLEKMTRKSALMSRAKTFYIPNPIDSKIFYIDPKQHQHRTDFESTEFTIGLCASDLSDSNKNIDLAVAAINSVARQFPGRNFCILAIGSNMKKYGLEKNVSINEVGSLNDDAELAKLYRSMDIFVNPSLQENFPTTLLEALAVGTPSIAWQSGGSEEIVSNDDTGYLVNSSSDLIDAISKMLDHRNLIRLTNQISRKRDEIIDISKCVELYNEVYRYSFGNNA